MAKSFLYRWFGLRTVPTEIRERLHAEGIVFDEEGTSCALRYRNFRGPRNRSGRGLEAFSVGSLVITEKSLYVQFPYLIVCDRPIEAAVGAVQTELEGPARLSMRFDVEQLFERATGGLSCLWRTDNAAAIHGYLRRLQAASVSS